MTVDAKLHKSYRVLSHAMICVGVKAWMVVRKGLHDKSNTAQSACHENCARSRCFVLRVTVVGMLHRLT